MALYIPKSDSLRGAICAALFERGPMDHGSIIGSFKGYRHNTVKTAIASLRDAGALDYVEETAVYALSLPLQKHYGQIAAEPAPEFQGEVTPGRYSKPFQPLKSLPWAVHAEKIRDISFKTASGAFQPLGYQS